MVVIERLRLRRLAWGDAGHLAALLKEFGCFNVIVGADVVYVEEALPLLLGSITTLLSQDPSVSLFPQKTPESQIFLYTLCPMLCVHACCSFGKGLECVMSVKAAHESVCFASRLR